MTAPHRVRGSCRALSRWGRSSQSQDSPPPRVVPLSLPDPHRSDLPQSFRPHPLRSRPLPLSSVLSQGCRVLRPWPSTPGSAETVFGFCICFVDLFSLFCFRFSNWAAVEASMLTGNEGAAESDGLTSAPPLLASGDCRTPVPAIFSLPRRPLLSAHAHPCLLLRRCPLPPSRRPLLCLPPRRSLSSPPQCGCF